MSYYLNPEHSRQRLLDEYFKYGGIIVAVDFDSTLIPYHIHEENADFERVRQLVRDLYAQNCTIIINTAAEESRWKGIIKDLDDLQIPYHLFNESPSYIRGIGHGSKVYANAYLDDRAGLWQVVHDLEWLVLQNKCEKAYKAASDSAAYLAKL